MILDSSQTAPNLEVCLVEGKVIKYIGNSIHNLQWSSTKKIGDWVKYKWYLEGIFLPHKCIDELLDGRYKVLLEAQLF